MSRMKEARIAGWKEQLKGGTCDVLRVGATSDGGETLCVQFHPKGWGLPLTVDFGDSDLEPFMADTPWCKVLETPVRTEGFFLGHPIGIGLEYCGGNAIVKVSECSRGAAVSREPFAEFKVPVQGKAGKEYLYAASVATYDEDGDTLTSHCAPFRSAGDAVKWVKTDWNEQVSAARVGKKMTKAQERELASDLERDGFAELSCPEYWPLWHVWKIVRAEA